MKSRRRSSTALLAHRRTDGDRGAPARRSSEPPASAPRPPLPSRRHESAELPQDEARYGCECGFQFSAAVSTAVDCPHCGHPQAW